MAEHEVEDSSSNGSSAASQAAVSTSRPSRCALASSVASIPGEMSVQVASPTTPACSRLSEKYPVPAPISSERGYGPGRAPSSLVSLPSTCAVPTAP